MAAKRQDAPLTALLPSWELSLADRDLSPRTQEIYARTGQLFSAWLADNGYPATVNGTDAPEIRAFLAAEIRRTSAVSAHQHYRNLRVLFRWLAREGERTEPNPMERVDPPKVTEKVKGILDEAELRALLKACDGTEFEDRRDTAIIRMLIDTGVRVSGLAGLKLGDLDLQRKLMLVTLKGGDEHLVPIGRKTAYALDRYLRARAKHAKADSPWLWLGTRGHDTARLGVAGVQHVLRRRGELAGIGRVNPHAFRRTAAHMMLAAGMQEREVMSVAGWKTPEMVMRYAGALAAERARHAHARLSPGDRI